ncbi:hypothetical protein N7494_000560 [Penicillium frequentans]|uniref:F-box domain-containing protein n=1 Tax=Penicillium frequentans TaxID=3151616 RepID=A0AAD6D619_9EURO|nr:hypothetical protein N7494_000560 [Penicillium glabrum]
MSTIPPSLSPIDRSRGLESLPWDILFKIAILLDGRDFVHLIRLSKTLYTSLRTDPIARQIVQPKADPSQNFLLFSKEGQLVKDRKEYSYQKAIEHRFDVHKSFATAAPYSVAVLAYGTDFLYNEGMLCYRIEDDIRLLDVHAAEKRERVLDLSVALQSVSPESVGADAVGRVSLLRYADNILIFRIHADNDRVDNNWAGDNQSENDPFEDDQSENDQAENDRALSDLVVVVDMTGHLIRFSKQIPSKAQVFVRQSDSYLWYGIFRATDISNGRWIVYGVDLRAAEPEPIETFRIQAANGALDQSVCFEMYKRHLYAVSIRNETYSSYYHCFCSAPGNKGDRPRVCNKSLWRREHIEGPIHDSWADISIRTDEITGRPVILECRREWVGNSSENHRTYYTQPLSIPDEFFAETGEEDITHEFDNDHLESQQSSQHRNEHRPAKRLRHEFHAEYEPTDSPNDRQEFIRAHTRHCSYNLAASTYIDIVNDPVPEGLRFQERLRIRTRPRKHEDFIDEKGALLPPNLPSSSTNCNDSEISTSGLKDDYVSRGAYLWPPENAPAELHRLLCPPNSFTTVRAMSDERSIIYSVRHPDLPPGYRALVLVSFDPQIGFSFLSSLNDIERSHGNRFPALAKTRSPNPLLLRETMPLYEHIRWGYWLR